MCAPSPEPALTTQHTQAVQSRLDALENDNADDAPDPFGLADGDDDEFVMGDSDEDGACVWVWVCKGE